MNNAVVFVVDDQPSVLQSISFLLEVNGFSVKSFASAEEFLDSYDTDQHGCLLLDVRMPGMTGFELQLKLHADAIELPVILMSGHADAEDAAQAKKNGALGFLQKPVDSKDLISIIKLAFNSR